MRDQANTTSFGCNLTAKHLSAITRLISNPAISMDLFLVSQCISPIAYNLALPPGTCIHDIFHVRKLKCCYNDPISQIVALPMNFINDQPLLKPLSVLNYRVILVRGQLVLQLLVKWSPNRSPPPRGKHLQPFAEMTILFTLTTRCFSEGRQMMHWMAMQWTSYLEFVRANTPIESQHEP